MSWTGPAEAKGSWTGPAEAKVSWTGPAEAQVSCTGPAEAMVSWTGPTLGGCSGSTDSRGRSGGADSRGRSGGSDSRGHSGSTDSRVCYGKHLRGTGTGGRWRGAGTGGRWRGAGTGGRWRGAGTGGRWRGAGSGSGLQTIPSKTTNKPRGTWGRSGSAELGGTSGNENEDALGRTSGDEDELDRTSGDEDELGRTSGDEDELDGTSGDTSGLTCAVNGDGLVELQTPVNSILFWVDYSLGGVTVHTGIQERGDEDITNRVFNGCRTEETQEHGEGHPNSLTHMTLTIIHQKHGAEQTIYRET